jgi:hypothetical protein
MRKRETLSLDQTKINRNFPWDKSLVARGPFAPTMFTTTASSQGKRSGDSLVMERRAVQRIGNVTGIAITGTVVGVKSILNCFIETASV